jgi:nucleoside-diphosphate-sugar epimerase
LKILLIGGNGFLGSRLLPSLIKTNNDIVIASRYPAPNQLKITPGDALGIGLNEFDLIINAAGKYGVKDTKEEINLTFEANVGVSTSISKSIQLIRKGVINLSSYFEILPKKSPIRNIYYTESKAMGNKILQNTCDRYEKYYSRVILYDNYDKDLSRGKFLDKLIQSIISGESMNIRNVEGYLNLLGTDQITEAIIQIVESFKSSPPLVGRIDIKNQNSYKIIDLITKAEVLSGRRLKFTNLEQNVDYELQKVILEKIKNQTNFILNDEVSTYLEKMLKTSV